MKVIESPNIGKYKCLSAIRSLLGIIEFVIDMVDIKNNHPNKGKIEYFLKCQT